MHRISELDYDRIYLAGEVGVFDQGDAQIRIVLAAVVFAQTDDVGLVPGGQKSLDYILQSSFRCLVRLNYGRLGLSESASGMFPQE
jgi:hypothetical protein